MSAHTQTVVCLHSSGVVVSYHHIKRNWLYNLYHDKVRVATHSSDTLESRGFSHIMFWCQSQLSTDMRTQPKPWILGFYFENLVSQYRVLSLAPRSQWREPLYARLHYPMWEVLLANCKLKTNHGMSRMIFTNAMKCLSSSVFNDCCEEWS